MSENSKGFSTTGKRLYNCGECGKGTFFTRREENRAGRLRCTACGSARLTMSAEGAERQAKTNDAKVDLIERREQ
jgi:DNA-directed RNA polymerase subunit RPC12/RpoP